MRLVNLRTLCVGVGAIALAACGDDVTVQNNEQVQLTLSSATCTVGQTVQLVSTVNGGGGNTAVTYAVAPATGVVTISGNTLTCAGPGSAVVTATTASGRTAQAAITVTAAQQPGVRSLQLTPSNITVSINGTQQITPTVTADPGANTAVTYRSANDSIATVSATGVITGRRAGITTIIATSVASPNIQAAAQVTVAQSSITSITATPSIVTLAPGNTTTIVPNVQAPAGVARTVTYTSNNTAVATVSATGVITAVRAGTAVITVASTVDPSFATQVQVTVQEPRQVAVTIQSVTFTNAQGQNVPVDPNNVAGPIQVTLNLDPGDQRVSRVEVLLGGRVVCAQTFSAAFAEAMRMAELNGSADVQPIVCPINTAMIDSIGRAQILNGQQTLQARVFTTGAVGTTPTTPTQTATIETRLTLNNVNTFFANITTTPSAGQIAQATDPAGLVWRAGTVNVNVFPVFFTPNTTTSQVTVNFAGLTRTATTANANGSFTVTFPGAPADAPNLANDNLNGYTSPATGDVVFIGTSVAGGNPGPGAIALGTVRLDNQTPQAPTAFTLAPNVNLVPGSQGAFIGGSFSFADSTALTSPLLTFAAGTNGDNGGVDRVFVRYFAGSSTAADTALRRVRTGADLAPSVIGGTTAPDQTYRLQARLTDALGNSRNIDLQNNAGQSLFFGVDVTAPTLAPSNAAGLGGTLGSNFAVTNGGAAAGNVGFAFSDDLSGFGNNPVFMSVVRLTGAGATGQVFECVDPNTGANIATTTGGVCPTVQTTGTFVTPTINGYYFVTAFVRDQAGNQSATRTQRFLVDGQAPVIGGIAIPALIRGGQPVNFTTSAIDNVELFDNFALLNFGSGVSFRYDAPVLSTRFDSTLTRSATVTGAVPFFIRQLEFTDAGGNIIPGPTQPQTVTVFVGDATTLPFDTSTVRATANYASQTVAIPSVNIEASTGSLTTRGLTTFSLTTSGATLSQRTGQGIPNTRTLTVTFTGPASTFNTPFARIELYIQDPTPFSQPTPNALRLFGTVGAQSITDAAGTRTVTASFTLTGNLTNFPSVRNTSPTRTFNFRAVGITANGDAVISQPVAIAVSP